jgi:hypothetical protein
MGEQETARCFYSAMRSEINQHLLIVNQIYTLYLGGTTALFAGALHKEGNHNLLLLIPYLSLGAANMLGSHERAIGSIAAYCAQELEDSLNKNGGAVTQWDRSKNLRKFKDSHFASNRAGGLTLVVFPGIAALGLAVFFIYSSLNVSPVVSSGSWIKIIAACIGALCLVRAGWIIIQTARYRKRLGDMHNQSALNSQPRSAISRILSNLGFIR